MTSHAVNAYMNLIEYKLQHIIRTEERKRRRLCVEEVRNEPKKDQENEEDLDGADILSFVGYDQEAASLDFSHTVSIYISVSYSVYGLGGSSGILGQIL